MLLTSKENALMVITAIYHFIKNSALRIKKGFKQQEFVNFPDKKYVMKYTTVNGINGFDGSRKEANREIVKSID